MERRRFRIFLLGMPVFLIAVVVISGVLSPGIYHVVDLLVPDRWPFKRVFNRVLMVSAVICLIPWLKVLGALSVRSLGFERLAGWWKLLCYGWGLGLLQVLLLAGVHLCFGAREWHWELSAVSFSGYVLSGVAVGVVEEFIFRGGLCLSLRDLPLRLLVVMVVMGSVFFALVHFPHARTLLEPVSATSGWQIWGDLGRQFLNVNEVMQRWVGLWLAGMCLCVAALRSGSLWLPIGLHAGWVCGIKSVNRISDATASSANLLWGGHPLDGMVAWFFLILLILFLLKGYFPSVERPA